MLLAREMTEIELVVPERDVLAVTEVLARRGVFHQIDASYTSSQMGMGTADEWRERATAAAALERRMLSMMEVLGIDEGVIGITASFEAFAGIGAQLLLLAALAYSAGIKICRFDEDIAG